MNRQALAAYVYNERARRASALAKGGGLPWYPNRLFQSGDILLWYDPSDLTTMFQNTAGTTPVTADGQSVALMLDKGQWGGKSLTQVLAAQTELVTNGTFDSGITGWTNAAPASGNISWSSGKVLVERVSGGTTAYAPIACTVGKYYRATYTFASVVAAAPRVTVTYNTGVPGSGETTIGTHSFFFLATATTMYIHLGLGSGNGTSATYDDISVKEIPGYHRTQATGTSMPKYKTGPNPAAAEASPELMTNGTFATDTNWSKSAGWTISGGVATHDGGADSNITQGGLENGKWYRATFSVTSIVDGTVHVRTNTGGATIAGGSVSQVGTFTFVFQSIGLTFALRAVGNTSPLSIDNISVKEIPASAPYIHWLLYDGTDDSSQTPTITWGTDEVAICAGVTKSSDAATGILAELSVSASANNGAFYLAAPNSAATNYNLAAKGTAAQNQSVTPNTYPAPRTDVLTGQVSIGGDSVQLRVSAVATTEDTDDNGTGNFGSYPMYFGRRAGTALPFNGREYQTVIRSRLLSAAELSSLETFVAAKSGVIL